MASRGQSVTITYRAWNTGTQAFQTGDVGNHTLRWIKDGTAAAPTNSPSQVDATYAPGVYKLTLTTAETNCNTGTLTGTSSTSNVKIFPVDIAFEQLPTATPGADTGLPILDSNLTVQSRLSTGALAAIWDRATSALSTSGSVGAYVVSKLGYITSSINLVTGSLVKTGDIVDIYQGRSFTITLDVPPATIDLTGFTGKLGLTRLAVAGAGTSTLEVSGTISNAGASGQKIVYTLSTTQTAALGLSPTSVANPLYTANKDTAYAYRWSISATNGAGVCPQLAQGWFDVKKSDTTC